MPNDLLRSASGLGSRRLLAFQPGRQARLESEHMENMAALRQLRAFRRFEAEVREALNVVRRNNVTTQEETI